MRTAFTDKQIIVSPLNNDHPATYHQSEVSIPLSKSHLARNMQILQVFFLQDPALNLGNLVVKTKLFLQAIKNLARILQVKFARILQIKFAIWFSCKILIKYCKKVILQFFLARFLQYFSYLARKASFLVQDLQNLVQNSASLARRILARFGYSLQDGFYWV